MAAVFRDDGDRTMLLAAAQLTLIVSEALSRAAVDDEPVDDETLEKLADASRMLVEAEFALDHEDNREAGLLYAATVRFLDAWQG